MSTRAPPIATLTVPSDPAYLTVCRQALMGAVADLDVTDNDLDDLKLLLSEACSNAIVHAYGRLPRGTVDRDRDPRAPDQIEVAVTDRGRGFPDGQLPEGTGLGLSLMQT